MAQPRKPSDIREQNLTVNEQQQRAAEEQLIVVTALPMKPPEAITNAEAREIWAWAVEQIKNMPLLGAIDVLNLEGMCNAFALYREATRQLASEPLVKESDSGSAYINPLVNTQKKYAEEYRAFARLCGFTVDSRLKLAAIKVKEIDDEITEDFGDI